MCFVWFFFRQVIVKTDFCLLICPKFNQTFEDNTHKDHLEISHHKNVTMEILTYWTRQMHFEITLWSHVCLKDKCKSELHSLPDALLSREISSFTTLLLLNTYTCVTITFNHITNIHFDTFHQKFSNRFFKSFVFNFT